MTRSDQENDLTTIDDALDTGRVTATTAHERELQELALIMRADAPAPDPDFAARLDERIAEGLSSKRRRPWLPALRVPGLAPLAVAASVLLALVVAVSLGGRDEQAQTLAPSTSLPAPSPAAPEALSEEDSSGGARAGAERSAVPPGEDILPPSPGGGGVAADERNRRVERSATLTLAAPGDRLEAVAADVTRVIDRRRGFVVNSTTRSGEEGSGRAELELRVPSAVLDETLAELAALGTVRRREVSGQDVTAPFATASDRLRAARAERRGLLRRLEKATGDQQAAAIRERIDLVSGEINGLRAQLRDLRERTSLATLRVSIEDEERGDGGGGGGSGTVGQALDDALDSLLSSVALALRVLGVALPLLVLAALAWGTASLLRRRRREAVLS